MEIIENFGINPLLLLAQIVNFLIIFFILKKFLFKPILEILKKREKTIKEGLMDAEEGVKTLEEAREKEKNILKNAQLEAEKIINDTKEQASIILKEAEEKAKKETQDLIKSAKEQIEQGYKEAEKNLTLKVSKVAVEFLEKSLESLFGDKKQKELMQIVIKKIRK